MTTPTAGTQIGVNNVDAELGISDSNRALDFLNGYIRSDQRPGTPNMYSFGSKAYYQRNADGNCNNANINNCTSGDQNCGGRCHACVNCQNINCVNCDTQNWLQANCNCACTYNCNSNVDCFNQNCACSKIICTKLYQKGMMDRKIFLADQQYGEWLKKNDRVVYRGYFRWARIVTSWMDGKGPSFMPWIKNKEERAERQKKFATDLTYKIGTPWSMHMAYLMGAKREDDPVGRILMNIGKPICRIAYYLPKSETTSTAMAMFMMGLFIVSYHFSTKFVKAKNYLKNLKVFNSLKRI